MTGQCKVVHQAKLSPGKDGEARDPGRGHSNVALNQDLPNLNKQENVNKFEKPAKNIPEQCAEVVEGYPSLERSDRSSLALSSTSHSPPATPSLPTPDRLPRSLALYNKSSER